MIDPRSATPFEPMRLGDLDLKNRIVLAPMTRGRAGAGRLANPLMAEYYAQRASAGLLITEATSVSEQGNGWVDAPGIYTEEMGRAWTQVVRAVHARGSKIFLQLWHTGRASHSSFHEGRLPVAPSAIRNAGEAHTPLGKLPYETPRALGVDELPGIVADYRAAARRAREAGFDGVEVHAANGYLLDQFLQSRTNSRGDAYGGSTPNRFRLLREVLEAVLQELPPSQVGVRLSPNGAFNDMGSPDYRETFLYATSELDRYDLAYLHVVDGLAFGFHGLGEAMRLEDFRAVYRGALIGSCGYDFESAERALEGPADLVAFGRPFIGNPDLVERFREGWPLAESDPETWYQAAPPDRGYVDYPTYLQATGAGT